MKDERLVSKKWKVKLIEAPETVWWLDLTDLTPLFYNRSTPLRNTSGRGYGDCVSGVEGRRRRTGAKVRWCMARAASRHRRQRRKCFVADDRIRRQLCSQQLTSSSSSFTSSSAAAAGDEQMTDDTQLMVPAAAPARYRHNSKLRSRLILSDYPVFALVIACPHQPTHEQSVWPIVTLPPSRLAAVMFSLCPSVCLSAG